MYPIALAAGLALGLTQLPAEVPPGPDPLPFAATAAVENLDVRQEDRYEVFLLTMDQGDGLWELFGHNALLIRDNATGEELAWNWGIFNLDEEGFFRRFIAGTMLYTMGPAPLPPFLDAYRAANRSVYANEVFLTQSEATELDRLIRLNFQPENRDYLYDYFLDNCSTRVRDLLDVVLGGAIREQFAAATTPNSYRWHVRRLVQEVLWIDVGMHFLMGVKGDTPRTRWETMFIPMELMESLEGAQRTVAGRGAIPLVGPREVLFEAVRSATPETPPGFSLVWLLLGLGGGALVLGLAARARSGGRFSRLGLGAAIGVWGLVSGAFGLLMVLAWLTDHEFAHWNVNIFYLSPLGPVLAALGAIALIRGERRPGEIGRAERATRGLAVGIAAASALAVVAQLTPLVQQGNAEVVALAIPLNLAIATAWIHWTGRSVPRPVSSGAG